MRAGVHAAKIEASHAETYGAGEESFAMRNLPGDIGHQDQGVKKTTRIDVDNESADGSQKSLGTGDLVRVEGHKDFM